eukprot:4884965-Pleurochrysis_carterae.AAC.1
MAPCGAAKGAGRRGATQAQATHALALPSQGVCRRERGRQGPTPQPDPPTSAGNHGPGLRRAPRERREGVHSHAHTAGA